LPVPTVRPSQVIIISEGLGGGGAVANVAWQQALCLSSQLPVCLITDGLTAVRMQQLANLPVNLRLRLLKVPRFTPLRRFAHFPRELVWILLALRAFQNELRTNATTFFSVICHSHPMAAALAWRFDQRINLVLVSHGDIFHRPRGTYDPAITCLYRISTGFAHRQASWSVALSPVMAERIQAHGVPSQRIALIPNGLDPREIGLAAPIPTPPEHWLQHRLRLLFVGRLDQIKGLDHLLSALALSRQDCCELQLDVVGDGTVPNRDRLKKLSESLGLAHAVNWLGPQERRDLAKHYQRCHVVVVPSLDDPLPTVVLEAMSCGRPVLGSAVGGISFLVEDGINGLLVPPAVPRDLADALMLLDRDRRFTASLGAAAYQSSLRYTWDANAHALHALINDRHS
jgi:glycosyltransferase involved in cell wall biosynthesis